MKYDNLRNSLEYDILENYAKEYEKYDNLKEFRKKHIEEIARENPKIWQVAKEDFDLYKNW